MRLWNTKTLRSLFVPGGILLAAVAMAVHSGWGGLAPSALNFLYWCVLIGGLLLAWRFRASRIAFALAVLFVAYQGATLHGGTHVSPGTPGWTVLIAAAVLAPVNFVLIGLTEERGFTASGTATMAMFLFVQIVIVSVLARGSELPATHGHHAAASFPGYVWVVGSAAGVILLARCFLTWRPPDTALFWSLGAFLLSLLFLGTAKISAAYAVTALTILATSVVETSYLLAYHDELTGLPSRRAFNDALLRLPDPFTMAAVDIDHFKKFNDTYGHDVGDQVLRLVAGRLANVTGGGQAYRCGGEEFTVLFRGKSVPEVTEHLEELRKAIKGTEFRVREGERRQAPRGPDRRVGHRRSASRKGDAIRQLAEARPSSPLSVTVSIGVAGSSAESTAPPSVLEAADRALYRAKANGRDRVEVEVAPRRRRGARAKSSGAA